MVTNKDPLMLSQPEDNLVNAFVVDRIVVELRDTKLKRQLFLPLKM